MDPGWLVLFFFMILEILLVLILCLPMPNNTIRGAITNTAVKLFSQRPVQITCACLLVLDALYFWFVFDAMLNPLYDFGILNLGAEGGITCEAKQDLFYNERNAYLTGFSLFLFLILHRLIDIQDKLHKARNRVKELEGGSSSGGGGTPSAAVKKRV
uniref:Endoplasmic reticulum transmembrane protein n=1 Tax=Entomoneis paludosa TaxID=265537 RepID=A0A7S2Y3Z1_9STRA|mmetsp:Transcript_15756/g.32615  ORF Transcript_15756/g.32615 Transcript_15756/m.32615 type:complete len:157 (+) Transcript_15756:698-1168(+)|eukprot:CAMPEP_0172455150 /NCGR_PEP_ID=MMETSP1065-20121228/11919_1 /TAXON_ID=265537 /ORGANISM="Amphiprora paludosa, Strain CCMP125" /LENGTH=156 /DNA_ID=CAMNT_0013207607 /DNA_START=1486 /DNA_END=1956 /DNA_ORIENTATION=+